MGRKVLAVTFCNVKVNSYIYGISHNCNSLLTYKWKVLSKEIQVSRLNGKFGGPKVTTVILTCKLVEYNGREEESGDDHHHAQHIGFHQDDRQHLRDRGHAHQTRQPNCRRRETRAAQQDRRLQVEQRHPR